MGCTPAATRGPSTSPTEGRAASASSRSVRGGPIASGDCREAARPTWAASRRTGACCGSAAATTAWATRSPPAPAGYCTASGSGAGRTGWRSGPSQGATRSATPESCAEVHPLLVGICEDDAHLRVALERALVQEGYKVRLRASGREAVERFAASAPDVL